MDDPSTAALLALSYANNIEAMRRVLATAERAGGRALGLTAAEIQHAIDALEQQRRHFALLAAKD